MGWGGVGWGDDLCDIEYFVPLMYSTVQYSVYATSSIQSLKRCCRSIVESRINAHSVVYKMEHLFGMMLLHSLVLIQLTLITAHNTASR